MLVTFSHQFPIEANFKKDSPFKTFLLDNSIAARVEISKGARQPIRPPACYSCNMHFSSASVFKINKWTCGFCGKVNETSERKNLLSSPPENYVIDVENSMMEEEFLIPEDGKLSVSNLIILVVDFGILMRDAVVKDSKYMNIKEWLDSIMKRDLPKLPEGSRFLLILCGSTITILNNDPNQDPFNFEFPYYNEVNNCLPRKFFDPQEFLRGELNDGLETIRDRLKKIDFKGLSSIGAGFALAVGIVQDVSPNHNQIFLIGEGNSYFGVCRSIEWGESRKKDSRRELRDLFTQLKNPQELNIKVFCGEERKNEENSHSFFQNLKHVFKGANIKNSDLQKLKLMPKEIKTRLRIGCSPNVVISAYEHEIFEEGFKVLLLQRSRNQRLFPFHFEFAVGKNSKNGRLYIQSECEVWKKNNLKIYVSTKQIFILDQCEKIDWPRLNFTVPFYIYHINQFFKDNEKTKEMFELMNKYIMKGGSIFLPLFVLLYLYLPKELKIKFASNFKNLWMMNTKDWKKMEKNFEEKNEVIDFEEIERTVILPDESSK